VILLSATPDLSKHAYELKVADCLDKPVNIANLLHVVERHYHHKVEVYPH
jgi:hypothetical protein